MHVSTPRVRTAFCTHPKISCFLVFAPEWMPTCQNGKRIAVAAGRICICHVHSDLTSYSFLFDFLIKDSSDLNGIWNKICTEITFMCLLLPLAADQSYAKIVNFHNAVCFSHYFIQFPSTYPIANSTLPE